MRPNDTARMPRSEWDPRPSPSASDSPTQPCEVKVKTNHRRKFAAFDRCSRLAPAKHHPVRQHHLAAADWERPSPPIVPTS